MRRLNRHPALESSKSELIPGALANLGLDIGRGLFAGGDIDALPRPHGKGYGLGGSFKDSLTNMYSKIPDKYHSGIESIGKAGLSDLGFGLGKHKRHIKKTVESVKKMMPMEFHPHMDRLEKHAISHVSKMAHKKLDEDSSSDEEGKGDFMSMIRDFGGENGLGRKAMNAMKPSYADSPVLKDIGETVGKLGGDVIGDGIKKKLIKGSPEAKEFMRKMREMKSKKGMKGGDLPPRSRSYVTDSSLL